MNFYVDKRCLESGRQIITLKGNPDRILSNLETKAIRFDVQHIFTKETTWEKVPELDYIAISPYYNLPSYCPWINYIITAYVPKENGSIFEVIKIHHCEKKKQEITKTDIAHFLKKCIKDLGEIVGSQEALIRKSILEGILKSVEGGKFPKNVTYESKLAEIVKENVRNYVTDLLRDYYLPEVGFQLLKYFDASFLWQFKPQELLKIYQFIQKLPFGFCFRSCVQNILNDIPFGGKGGIYRKKLTPSQQILSQSTGNTNTTINTYLFPSNEKNKFEPARFYCKDKEWKNTSKPQNQTQKMDKLDLDMYCVTEDQQNTDTHDSRVQLREFQVLNHGKRLTSNTYMPLHFQWKHHFWSVRMFLDAAYEYFGFDYEEVEEEIVIEALKIYLKCEDMKNSFGRVVFSLTKDLSKVWPDDKEKTKKLVEFFSKYKILIPPKLNFDRFFTDLNEEDTQMMTFYEKSLIYPEVEKKEVELALIIENNVETLTLIDCNYYNDRYVQRLVDVINEKKKSNILAISSGIDTSWFMTNSTGINFYYPQNLISYLEGNTWDGKCDLIVFDRIHKISVDHFQRILELIVKKVERFELFLIGDESESSIHASVGVGNLFKDFQAFHGIDEFWNIASFEDDQDPMEQMYSEILADKFSNIDYRNINSYDEFPVHKKEFFDECKKKFPKKQNPHLTSQIFCSNEEDKNTLLNLIVTNRPNAFSSYKFMGGDLVLLTHFGMIGKLTEIKRMVNSFRWEEVQGKKETNMTTCPHRVTVKNEKIEFSVSNTETNIVHAEVCNINNYSGTPIDLGIFFATENTTKNHILSALKCTRKAFKIVTMKTELNSLTTRAIFRSNTGLPEKFRMIRKE